VNRAFRNYYSGEYEYVPGDVVKAVTRNFKYLLNKGVLSILFRSLLWRTKLTGRPTL
jgi:hypothetical protein